MSSVIESGGRYSREYLLMINLQDPKPASIHDMISADYLKERLEDDSQVETIEFVDVMHVDPSGKSLVVKMKVYFLVL